MRIHTKTTNFDLTEAISIYIEEKLRGLEKHLTRVASTDEDAVLARVEVGRTTQHHHKGDIYKASISLEIPGEPNMYAEAVESDLHVALDTVGSELERELRRSHEKHKDAVRSGGRKAKQMLRERGAVTDEE